MVGCALRSMLVLRRLRPTQGVERCRGCDHGAFPLQLPSTLTSPQHPAATAAASLAVLCGPKKGPGPRGGRCQAVRLHMLNVKCISILFDFIDFQIYDKRNQIYNARYIDSQDL